MKHHVLILGAGFGGLELATRLTEIAPDEVEIHLIDKSDYFYLGLSKIDVMFGRKTAEQIKSYYRDLPHGIQFHKETVLSIDAANRRVTTDTNTYETEFLVVALGADVVPEATPGMKEDGEEFYTLSGADKLSRRLPSVSSGIVLLGILGLPYKCPPAPFEATLQLYDYFQARGVGSKIRLRVAAPTPNPLPVSKEGAATILRLFGERSIEFLAGHQIVSIDPKTHQAKVKEKPSIPYDLFIGIPIHRPPQVVSQSGLVGDGWVAVDSRNLETKFANVFAIGDVIKIPVGQGALPKAGAFADRAAGAVADEIVYRIRGTGSPAQFDGQGECFLEFGAGNVAKISANFLGGPAPDVQFIGPDPAMRADKDRFISSRISRWFKKN